MVITALLELLYGILRAEGLFSSFTGLQWKGIFAPAWIILTYTLDVGDVWDF